MNTLSHNNGTISEHEAAEKMQISGKASRHRAIVLEAISNQQGKTGAQIGEITGLGHIEAQRRISDLKNANVVKYGKKIMCPINKNFMQEVLLNDWH